MTDTAKTLPNKSSIVEALYTVRELDHLPENSLTPDQKANLTQAKFILSKAKNHPDMSEARNLAATAEPEMKKGGKVKKYMGGGKVKKYMGGGKVYASHNKRYSYGGKVSGRKANYKY